MSSGALKFHQALSYRCT